MTDYRVCVTDEEEHDTFHDDGGVYPDCRLCQKANRMNTIQQGRAIVECNEGGDLLLMLPTGEVVVCGDVPQVQREVKNYARRHLKRASGDVGILRLEWRGDAAKRLEGK